MTLKLQQEISVVVAALAALLLLATLFLPFVTATKEYSLYLDLSVRGQKLFIGPGVSVSVEQQKNVSLSTWAYLYKSSTTVQTRDNFPSAYEVLVWGIGIFAAVACVCAFMKEPLFALASGVVSFLLCLLVQSDFKSQGIAPSNDYNWGIAFYLQYVAIALFLIGCVWLIVVLHRLKKAENAATPELATE